MPKLTNDPEGKATYTGKENTPKGRGFGASFDPIGQRRKGLDKKWYIVTEDSKGKKKWTLLNAYKQKERNSQKREAKKQALAKKKESKKAEPAAQAKSVPQAFSKGS
jgi:hypothetical protein